MIAELQAELLSEAVSYNWEGLKGTPLWVLIQLLNREIDKAKYFVSEKKYQIIALSNTRTLLLVLWYNCL